MPTAPADCITSPQSPPTLSATPILSLRVGIAAGEKDGQLRLTDTYHLHFGNESGQPGTLITFCPWPGGPRRGAGQATTVSFSVPQGSLGWWRDHLMTLGIPAGQPITRSGEDTLMVHDPDGLVLELAAHPEAAEQPVWRAGRFRPGTLSEDCIRSP